MYSIHEKEPMHIIWHSTSFHCYLSQYYYSSWNNNFNMITIFYICKAEASSWYDFLFHAHKIPDDCPSIRPKHVAERQRIYSILINCVFLTKIESSMISYHWKVTYSYFFPIIWTRIMSLLSSLVIGLQKLISTVSNF